MAEVVAGFLTLIVIGASGSAYQHARSYHQGKWLTAHSREYMRAVLLSPGATFSVASGLLIAGVWAIPVMPDIDPWKALASPALPLPKDAWIALAVAVLWVLLSILSARLFGRSIGCRNRFKANARWGSSGKYFSQGEEVWLEFKTAGEGPERKAKLAYWEEDDPSPLACDLALVGECSPDSGHCELGRCRSDEEGGCCYHCSSQIPGDSVYTLHRGGTIDWAKRIPPPSDNREGNGTPEPWWRTILNPCICPSLESRSRDIEQADAASISETGPVAEQAHV